MANGEPSTDIYDGLETAAGGDIGATKELLGCIFTLLDFETVETKFKVEKTGEPRITHIATLILDGEDEERRFWLGGVQVNRQLIWLKASGALPLVISLGGEGTQDSPYILLRPKAEPAPTVPAAATKKTIRQKLEDPLAHFRTLPGGQLDFDKFVRTLEQQAEGFTRYELTAVIGAYSAQALEHWLKAKNGTITDLKNAILAQRERTEEPEAEGLPFE